MKKTFNKGFTLIELLVVVAIIGILASVILASLNTARAKGVDAATKSDLANARAQAEIYYDGNGNQYSGVCTTATSSNGINTIIADAVAKLGTGYTLNTTYATAGSASTVTCHDVGGAGTGWAAQVPLRSVSGNYFCVDSTGQTKQDNAVLPASSVVCQ